MLSYKFICYIMILVAHHDSECNRGPRTVTVNLQVPDVTKFDKSAFSLLHQMVHVMSQNMEIGNRMVQASGCRWRPSRRGPFSVTVTVTMTTGSPTVAALARRPTSPKKKERLLEPLRVPVTNVLNPSRVSTSPTFKFA